MRRSISSGSPFEPTMGFSRAVRVDSHVFVSATAAIWPDGNVDADEGEPVGVVHGEVFGEVRPASAFIVVSGFLDPRWRVEIEADAVIRES